MHYGLYGGYLLLVAYICLKPMPNSEPILPHLDKVVHFGIYFTAILIHFFATKSRRWIASVCFLLCYGVTIEVLQEMSGYRSFELLDTAANSTGLLAGLLAYKLRVAR